MSPSALPLGALSFAASSLPSFLASDPEAPSLELSPVVLVVLVAFVDVEVAEEAAFSMLVSVGGVMSGVLLG
jgi:hypothetical protein